MRQMLPHSWPGVYLLVALSASGCQTCRPCCCSCTASKGVPVAARSPSAPAQSGPTKHVATYPKLPPAVSTSDKPALSSSTDYQQSAAPAPGSVTVNTAANHEPTDTSFPVGPRYGHDPNYRWLIGTVDYSRIQAAWVLRYASWDEEDRYGGCVTLVAPGRGAALKAGQTVRVEGDLIDPNSRQLRPAFQVRDIRVEGS